MLGASFRSLVRPVLVRAGVRKQIAVLLIVPLFAGACGSSKKPASAAAPGPGQAVRGPGFRFSAPAGWRQQATATSVVVQAPSAAATLVSAAVYRLGKAYTPDQFAAATSELDGVATRLARAASGKVTASETTTVAGRKIRAYRFTATVSGKAYRDRVGFVLDGKREVQLLCQAPAGKGDPDGACARLFSSFSLS
jgi:hypothetical protein